MNLYPGKWDQFTQAYRYYGIQETKNSYIIREWLPEAKKCFFLGEFNNWNEKEFPMFKDKYGVFSI